MGARPQGRNADCNCAVRGIAAFRIGMHATESPVVVGGRRGSVPTRLIQETLDAWREGERLLDGLPAHTADREIAEVAVNELRDQYQMLTGLTTVTGEVLQASREIVEAARETLEEVRARQSVTFRDAGTA
jgi:hypothetical protein